MAGCAKLGVSLQPHPAMTTYQLPNWPHVYGSPSGTGKIRSLPEDFFVHEQLAFEPSGSGEHAFVQIEKTGENTEYVARQLARFANVRQRDVSFAGMKDRHAVTQQWFSVWLPGKADPDWSQFETEQIRVLQSMRHARKLKRGVLSGNQFVLTIRDWQGDQQQTEQQLHAIKAQGIANYYGEQRFGHGGQNVSKALAMFQGAKVGREQQSLYLSAARSWLFNHILAERVRQGTWNQAVAGDTYMFSGSHSCFQAEQVDAEIIRRIQEQIIHGTGVLWGKGDIGVFGAVLQLEQDVLAAYPELSQGLITSGVVIARRPLRVPVADLSWQFVTADVLQLSFTLPAGSFATALLREIVVC